MIENITNVDSEICFRRYAHKILKISIATLFFWIGFHTYHNEQYSLNLKTNDCNKE